jgi:Spermidine/putrescine-binding periplasmic protein
MRLFLIIVIMVMLNAPPAAALEELHILAGTRMIPEALVDRFQQESGIRLKIEYFDSPEALAAYLGAHPRGDLALVREHHLGPLVNNRQLSALDHARLPGLRNLSPQALDNPADPGCHYSFPYTVGSLGIIYRRDVLDGEPDGWPWLFGQYAHTAPFAMANQYRDVMCAALISQGYSCNSTSPLAVEQAVETLRQVEKHPAFIGFLDVPSTLSYLKERIIYAAFTYDNVAAQAMAEDPGLAFTRPGGEGINWSWIFVFNKQSQNPEAAYRWLEFLLDPQVAAAVSMEYDTATPNQAALEYLGEATKRNTVIYPPSSQAAKPQMPLGIDEKSEKLYIDYWSRLKKK